MIPRSWLVACHLHHPQTLPRHRIQSHRPAFTHQNLRPSHLEKTSVQLIQRSSSPAHHPQCTVLRTFVSHSLSRTPTNPCPAFYQQSKSIPDGTRSTILGQRTKEHGPLHPQTHGIRDRHLGMTPALGVNRMASPRHKALASMIAINSKKNTGGIPRLLAMHPNGQAPEYYRHI